MPASDRAGGSDRPVDPWWVTLWLLVVGAVTFLLAFPPFGLWPLIVVAPAAMTLAAIRATSTRRVVLLTFLTQTCMWLWMQRWLIGVTVAGYPLLAMALAAFPLVFIWIVRRAEHRGITQRIPWFLLLPVAWTGVEFFRGAVAFDGYPWFLIGIPWIEAPVLAQSADLFSVYLTSFLCGMAAGAAVDVVEVIRGRAPRRRAVTAIASIAVVLGSNVLYGAWRLGEEEPLRAGPSILAIQTNLPQSNKMKWTREQQVEDVRSFLDLTLDAHREASAGGDRVDLIVWPETMLPGFGMEPETVAYLVEHGYYPHDTYTSAIEWMVDDLKTPMLVGSPSFEGLAVVDAEWRWKAHYNSAYLVAGEPPYQRYDKLFLTPFGETMPYISKWPWLEDRLLAIGAAGMSFDLDVGQELKRLTLDTSAGPLTLTTPICFEDTVPRVVRRLVWEDGEKACDLIVNLSNDGWFGPYDDGRLQHVQAARFRAIENRVPMVRAANTGLSVHVDSCGRVVGWALSGRKEGLRVATWLEADVTLDGRTTLYSRVRELLGWACLGASLIVLLLTFLVGSRRDERKPQEDSGGG